MLGHGNDHGTHATPNFWTTSYEVGDIIEAFSYAQDLNSDGVITDNEVQSYPGRNLGTSAGPSSASWSDIFGVSGLTGAAILGANCVAPTPPPAECPPGQTGTPPNCVTPPPVTECPVGQVGTWPICTTPPPPTTPPTEVPGPTPPPTPPSVDTGAGGGTAVVPEETDTTPVVETPVAAEPETPDTVQAVAAEGELPFTGLALATLALIGLVSIGIGTVVRASVRRSEARAGR